MARDLSRNKTVTTHELLVVTDENGKVIHEEHSFADFPLYPRKRTCAVH